MADKKQERISIFIDGSNLYHSLKDLKISKINFQKLADLLKKGRLLISAFYYNAPLDISVNVKKYWDQQKFFDVLRRIPGFNVVLCRMKKYKGENGTFEFEVKGDDVYLATDLISGAYEDLYDTALIVSGDEDFVPAIRKVQKLGKKVENIYFCLTSSNYLKETCDTSFCIDKKIAKLIELK